MSDLKPNSTIKYFLIIFSVILIIAGVILIGVGVLDYDRASMIIGRLTPDGHLESLTPPVYSNIRIPFIAGGCFLISIVVWIAFAFKMAARLVDTTLKWFTNYLSELFRDSKDLTYRLTHLGFEWWEWGILILILILVIVYGWAWIEKPMVHDESYTFIAFAKRPLIKVISDYHLPNNHILNSILIHLLYKIVGNPSPAVVRFPSYVSGVLCVLLAFLWSRKTYGRAVAFPGAVLVAVLPQFIVQSTNGRGYVMMAAFTLVMLGTAEIVRRRKNRAAWVILTLATTLSFYTQPITVYPFVIVGFWLFLSALIGDISKAYAGFWQFVKHLAAYACCTGLFTFILHSPIFLIGTGWDSFFNNSFVKPLSWSDFVVTFPIRLNESFIEWTNGVPGWAVVILCIGFVFSLLFHFHKPAHKIPLQFCIIFCLVVMFIIQRPNSWARTWTYLVPPVLIFCIAGLVQFWNILFVKQTAYFLKSLIPILLTATIFVLGLVKLVQDIRQEPWIKGETESITLWLKDKINEEDVVLASTDFAPAFWYYFDRHQLPMNTIVDLQERTTWNRVYFLVDHRENESYTELLPSGDLVSLKDCPEQNVKSIYQYNRYTVYLCTK